MSAEELRRRVDDDVGTVLDRSAEVGGDSRRVDDERDPMRVRDLREASDVGDVVRRIGHDLGEDEFGVVADRSRVVGRIPT